MPCSVRQRNQIIKNVIDFGFGIITVRFNFSRKVIKSRKLLFVFCGNRRQPKILIKERFQIRQNVISILNCHFHLPLFAAFAAVFCKSRRKPRPDGSKTRTESAQTFQKLRKHGKHDKIGAGKSSTAAEAIHGRLQRLPPIPQYDIKRKNGIL